MIATGSMVLTLGGIVTAVGFATWADKPWVYPRRPATEIGVGLAFATLGATLLGVGVKQRKRWKASLHDRVQLQPMVGFAQLGVAGRF
jgi:hypothetical protein